MDKDQGMEANTFENRFIVFHDSKSTEAYRIYDKEKSIYIGSRINDYRSACAICKWYNDLMRG